MKPLNKTPAAPLLLLLALPLLSGCGMFNKVVLYPKYRAAMSDFKKANYTEAISEYENLLTRYPRGSMLHEKMLYHQAVSYFRIRDYHDAERRYRDYQQWYPAGDYLADVQQSMVRVEAARAAPNPAAEERLQAAVDNRDKLLALEGEHPTDPLIKYHLGNIFYQLGEYKQAGEYYFAAQALEAAYLEKDLVRNRLAMDASGQPTTYTPDDLLRQAVEKDPVEVFDVITYYDRNSENAFNARQAFYLLTGKARNRGTAVLKNVVVEVRFVNALNQMLDFQTVSLGTMYPGDVLPFKAQARHFDNILNIHDYEIYTRIR